MSPKEILLLGTLAATALATRWAVIQDGQLWIRISSRKQISEAISEEERWINPLEPGREFFRDLNGRFVPFSS